MSLIQDRLSTDIDQILKSGNYAPKVNLFATIHTPTSDIEVKWLVGIMIHRDYNSSIGEYMQIEFRLTAEQYKAYVEPYRDNLELSLYGKYASSDNIDSNTDWPYEERYKLLIMNQLDTQGDKADNLSRSDLERSEMKIIKAQCLLRELETLRTITADGIYRNISIKDFLYWLYTNDSDYGKISGENIKYVACIYPPNNENTMDQLILPSGIRLMDVPGHIQEKGIGIYKGNLGVHMQKMYTKENNETKSTNTIFIYPLYNKDMYDNTNPPKRRLMIFYPSNHLWDSSETNYIVDGDTVKILASGKVQSMDDGENTINDTGTGYITNNPMAVLTQNLDVQDSSADAEPSSSLTAIRVKDKRDNNVYTPFIPNVANEYVIQSELARNTMCGYMIKWRYCDMNLIYPGMPVCFIRSTTRDDIIELKGSVQATFCQWDNTNKTFTGIIHIYAEKYSLTKDLEDWKSGSDTESLLLANNS